MSINEVTTTTDYGTKHHSIRLQAKTGKVVIVCHSENSKSWTVYFNPMPRRSFGKTFWSPDEMIAHYKTIRVELTAAMQQINGVSN